MLRLLIVIGIFFVRRVQPIFIIRCLIIIVLCYSYVVYNVLGGYWFSYALVIVILRGVLVLFTYLVRLVPNERFENYNLLYIFTILTIIMRGLFFYLFNDMDYVSLNIWSSYFRIFNLFIVRFLLRIILIVVWLRYMNEGALRVSYKYAWLKD